MLIARNRRQLMASVKRAKLEMAKIVCTHSGTFHADEALAVYMLKLLPEFKTATIVRSRKPEDWEKSDIVVDVSGKYDGVKFFDHHQRGFYETFEGRDIKLSSVGLTYKHFGHDIIRSILDKELSTEDINILYHKVYQLFIEALDANDNGINCYDEGKPKFSQGAITIPGVISGMNPDWNEDNSPGKFDEQFGKASEFIGNIFVDLVKRCGNSWLPAKALVRQAVEKRFEVDKSGKIIEFSQFCPWKDHLFDIEEELGIKNQIQFVLFPDNLGSWRVTTVPVEPGSFKFRQGILEPWRGVRDEELSEKSGIPGCIFVHAAGFTGGTKTKEGALQMARRSL